MTRTKLADRQLPVYTRGEEIFNMVTHIVGGGLGLVAMILCIIRAGIHHSAWGVISSLIYGCSLIILFTMSAIYHGINPKHDTAKKVFQILDHCTIFVLIAGSYTPVLLCKIRPYDSQAAWMLFAIVWSAAIIGIVLNAIDIKRYKIFSMICYLAMGWCILFKFTLLPITIGWNAIILLLLGGIAYTIGTVFYGAQKKAKYMHSIWHLWILAGAILHFFAIIIYVL